MRRVLGCALCAGLLMLLMLLAGCRQASIVTVTITPNSGHPPFQVVIEVQGATSTSPIAYTFELYADNILYDTISGIENSLKVMIHVDPRDWKCKVLWDDGGHVVGSETVRVGLVNSAPNGFPPQMTGTWINPGWITEASFLHPGQPYIFDFTYRKELVLYPGFVPREWGIIDPDGDSWKIVGVRCWAESKGRDHPDSVYTYPYDPDEFWVKREPGFLVFPFHTAVLDAHGRPKPPMALPWPGNGGYAIPCFENPLEFCDGVEDQRWTMEVTAEDQYGARKTLKFRYRLLPVAGTS